MAKKRIAKITKLPDGRFKGVWVVGDPSNDELRETLGMSKNQLAVFNAEFKTIRLESLRKATKEAFKARTKGASSGRVVSTKKMSTKKASARPRTTAKSY